MAKVQATMSTEIALDLVRASESVKSLTNVVSHATNAWKAQEAQLRAVGDYTQAAETKYKGLGDAIQAQQAKIDALKQKQAELKGNTQQSAEQYLKYQQQIDQATTKLAGMEAQQSKAKQSLEYYQSGLSGLQSEYKKMNELSESYVKRLQAEGKHQQAAKEKLNNLKDSSKNLEKQYETQTDQLKKLEKEVGKNTEAYRKQRIRVNETAASLAKSKAEIKNVRAEMQKMNPNIFTRMKTAAKKFNDEAKQTSKIGGRIRDFVTGNLIANGISNITSKVISLAKEGYAAAEAASKTAERWQNLGFAEEEINRINATVKDLKYNTNLSGGAIGELILKFHGITHNVDEARELAKGVGSLSDQLKLSQEGAEAFAGGLGKIEASGKVTATALNKLEKQAPGLNQALQKASGLSEKAFSDLLNSGKMTSQQFNAILKKAAENYEENAKKYASTAEGAKKQITLAWADTKKALAKPLVKVASTGLGQLAKVLQNPAVQNAVTKLGEGIGNLAKKAIGLLDYITAHQKDVSGIINSTIEIAKLFGLGVWEGFKSIVTGIAGAINKMTGHSQKAKDPLKNVATAMQELGKHKKEIIAIGKAFAFYFVANKTVKGVVGLTKGIVGLGNSIYGLLGPWGLLVAGIVAVGVGLVALYKHNKKFRTFIDGIVKSVKNFYDGVVKWFSGAFKVVGKFFSGIGKGIKAFNTSLSNGVKKVGKFLGDAGKAVVNFGKTVGKVLIFANPFVLGFALMYKHSKTFRTFIKALVNGAKSLFNGFKKFFGAAGKFVGKTFDGIKKGVSKKYNQLSDSVSSTSKRIGKEWNKHWNNAKDFLSTSWDNMNKASEKKFGKNLKGLLFDNLADIGKKFQETWDGISKGFGMLWQGMKDLARKGINALIDIPNAGIDGINSLIHDFGGPKQTIGKIPHIKKFASGTGLFSNQRNPITQPTLALLNDGDDSPETGNKEMVIMPNGNHFIVPGRNTKMFLPAGAEVLNASETALLMAMQNQKAFAKGTGFWSNLWKGVTNFGGSVAKVAGNAWDGIKDTVSKFAKMLAFIGEAVTNPIGTLEKKFNPSSKNMKGMYDNFGGMLFKNTVNGAKTWWKELWNMAKSASDEGGVTGNMGDDYNPKWRAMAKDAMADPWGYFIRECVSFVANRLNNLGVPAAKFSFLGNGSDWVNARVPHTNNPRPGMVAVYGLGSQFGNHVAMVSGVSGGTISGEEYNWGGDGKYHAYSGRPISGVTTFLDFGVKGGDSNTPALSEANNPLQKHIKKQVGGMFDWIKRFLAPQSDDGAGPTGGGTGVERWRNTVIRALKKNGFEASDSQVNAWMRVIQRESNGDPRAVNNWDSNAAAGIPSKGLVQTIEPTFNAYKFPGHNNIFNGYDNLLAGIAYAAARYGRGPGMFARVSGPLGYANGGLVTKHGLYEVAEGNQPEYIIPMDAAKRGRAWRLLQRVVGQFVGESPADNLNDVRGENSAISALANKLDTVIALLTQLVANGANPIEIRNIIDGQSVANGLAPYTTAANTNYERRQALLRGEII
ncbi:tape measure protein [Streptococcus intermedius]